MRKWNGTTEAHIERLVSRARAVGRVLLVLGVLSLSLWLSLVAGWSPLDDWTVSAQPGAMLLELEQLAGDRFDKVAVNKATLGKALFRSGNREPDKVVDELGQFELRGVFVRAGVAKAGLRDTKRKKTLVKQVGDTLGSFEVVEIGENGVRLRRGDEEVTLSR